MSKVIIDLSIAGGKAAVGLAEQELTRAIESKGEAQKVEFPDTAFYFPVSYALFGLEVKTLGDAKKAVALAKGKIEGIPITDPGLGDALSAGTATLISAEVIAGLRYLYGTEPQNGCEGFFSDTILRTLGIQLVDGRLPGFAAILGAAPDNKAAVALVRDYQQHNVLMFVGGETNGRSIIDQLIEEKVELGWDNYIVPFGRDTVSAIYPINWAIRGAMTFGGVKPGNAEKCLEYTKNRVLAVVNTLGAVDALKVAAGAGALTLGFPIIADTEVPEVGELIVKELDHRKIVQRSVELRGIKSKIAKVDAPVAVSAAFEGERVRREQTRVEFGGKYSKAFEWLITKTMAEVEDGRVEVIGPDVDTVPEGTALPLGIVVEVAGRKMLPEFEPILERQIHHFLSFAMGVFHMGQRNMIWVRISKDTYAAGFRLVHFGKILHAMMLDHFPALVDKVQVKIITNLQEVEKLSVLANKAYDERDRRIAGLTDDKVDLFYSCTLCQSYAPNHVCVITPEKLGLCGAYNWLDGKAAYEINPKGMNQPINKGSQLDTVKGEWSGVNEFVFNASNKTLERFCNYGIMEFPTTSCGCFECVIAILPECNGVMIVNRGYTGMTPVGMTFTQLAGSVGGGAQTPGFLGVGKLYITSKKFLVPEGGLHRIVWMTKELKDALDGRLRERANEIGDPGFIDKIADESVTTDITALVEYLQKNGHPALKMASII
ncbi:MAG: acetyl-CoA decarbonylase/synthase complex subunit alpha/beta [Elusimicrobiota bacterium]